MRTMPFFRSVLAAAVVLTLPAAAFAQLDAAQIRGSVVDAEGQPLAGVEVEMTYKGESRTKIVKTATTDKKGGFVRVGMKGGNWSLVFRKDGFKPTGIDTYLSIGGLSEIPPVTLAVAAPDPAAQAAAAAAAAAKDAAAQAAATAGKAKELGEAYGQALAMLQAGQNAEAEAAFKTLVAE